MDLSTYEAPCIERIVEPDTLDREVHYNGNVVSGAVG